ncbi:hypothetical protein [Henriciella litoralis]|uniref:hypothetical protein n=1 Tax=Henriciella litoralis TaxID=568102 RepID=UPI00111C0E4D|nr:hypothetical protein [Henriciella litoralis]
MVNAYTAESVGDAPDAQALKETRQEIDQAFETVFSSGDGTRQVWADHIASELDVRDFSAARGYLLAAPVMLDREDSRAILAAAAAEESGDNDQRLTNAALLFLPNDVRASYQRAIERPQVLTSTDPAPTSEEPSDSDADAEADSDIASNESVAESPPADAAPSDTPATTEPSQSFTLIGDNSDLVRRSQRWANGEPVNTTQLRLIAISQLQQDDPAVEDTYRSAISVLRGASRARRLTPQYTDYIIQRVDLAMPEAQTLASLRRALVGVAPNAERERRVLAAYQSAIDADGMARLERDLFFIARIAKLTSPTGAMTMLEVAETPEDVKKMRLVAEAGGDRGVALTKQIGRSVTSLAQIGVQWSTSLILQLLALLAIVIALCWSTYSALGRMTPQDRYHR